MMKPSPVHIDEAGGAQQRRRQRTAMAMAGVAGLMLGAAFAAVPLYDLICRATGLGGTTQRATAASQTIVDKTVTMRFDGTVSSGLPWAFKPMQQMMDVRYGETVLAFYEATNTSDTPVVGTARFNVTPEIAGKYFNKIECFCFTEQRLEPGQRIDMPVSLFVDPEILKDPDAAALKEITLSYTFFKIPDKSVQVSSGKQNELPAAPKALQ